MKSPVTASSGALDPLPVLKGLASLRWLVGTYPSGHPMINQRLYELEELVRQHLHCQPELHIDIIHGSTHVDGVRFDGNGAVRGQIARELSELGIDSLYIRDGVDRDELLAVAELLSAPRSHEDTI